MVNLIPLESLELFAAQGVVFIGDADHAIPNSSRTEEVMRF